MWDRLMQVVKTMKYPEEIAQYEKYLANDYASELISLYMSALGKYPGENSNRDDYRKMCMYLARVIKLGGKKQVDEFVTRLRIMYPRRRALMDELDKL